MRENTPTDLTTTRSNNIESLVLASQIIETLARYKTPIGVSSLAYELDTSKARISRFLTTMLDLGWVQRGQSGRGYTLGWHLLQFGQVATANNPINEHLASFLVELRNTTGKATLFCMPAGLNAVVTLSLPSRETPAIYVRPGAPPKFPNSASARILCAFQDHMMERVKLASSLPIIEQSLFHSLHQLELSLQKSRTYFFAATRNTKSDQLGAIAAPVFDANNLILGTVTQVFNSRDFEQPEIFDVAQEIICTSRLLSEQMGATRWKQEHTEVPREAFFQQLV